MAHPAASHSPPFSSAGRRRRWPFSRAGGLHVLRLGEEEGYITDRHAEGPKGRTLGAQVLPPPPVVKNGMDPPLVGRTATLLN